jgi:hypothetical protein
MKLCLWPLGYRHLVPLMLPSSSVNHAEGQTMKKIAIATAAVLALLSVAGCANVGKGKAPPPVVTKG